MELSDVDADDNVMAAVMNGDDDTDDDDKDADDINNDDGDADVGLVPAVVASASNTVDNNR